MNGYGIVGIIDKVINVLEDDDVFEIEDVNLFSKKE